MALEISEPEFSGPASLRADCTSGGYEGSSLLGQKDKFLPSRSNPLVKEEVLLRQSPGT